MNLPSVFAVFWVCFVTTLFTTTSAAVEQEQSSFLRHLQSQDFSCDVFTDRCTLQGNGQCDDTNAGADCLDRDCFDCDRCRQFDYDCSGCLQQTGCNWCPGDATCYNSPFYIIGACRSPEDYTTDSCFAQENHFFDDPLFSAQRWVFDMINLNSVWEKGYFGNGIRVRINDNGVYASHPEFDDRFDRGASCDIVEPPNEVFVNDPDGVSHGTAVAAILGGGANNGVCSVGVAPQVTLSACYALSGLDILAEKLDSFDISQNSYGSDGCESVFARNLMPMSCPFIQESAPCGACDFTNYPLSDNCENAIVNYCFFEFENDAAGCLEFLDILVKGGECEFNTLTEFQRVALTTGVTEGRNGKGIVYVFAAGNAYGSGDDTNFQSFQSSRLVITVGAVGKDRSHARYSTTGASVFVSGPGGDSETVSNHITAGIDGTCIDAQVGTSNACPVVSGVIALMLEANTDLSWRDVQGIIATTSQPVDNDPDDDTDEINGAGIWHSNFYGFGIVNAEAAVAAAETWELFGPERMVVGESGTVDLPLSETTSTRSVITISGEDNGNFVTESVNVYLDLQHLSRGHLEVVLTSPEGTRSFLSPGNRPESTFLPSEERWKLLTVRHWGESPVGTWTLDVIDLKEGNEPTAAECTDYTWFLPSQPEVDCEALGFNQFCVGGVLDPNNLLTPGQFAQVFETLSDGRTAEEACCECGGGIPTSDIVDQLRQWRIVAYGRDTSQQNPTPAPVTAQPSSPPVSSPPTGDPTIAPSTSRPSMGPSVATGLPTSSPTTAPTMFPSTPIPTTSPESAPPTTGPSLSPVTAAPSMVPTIAPVSTPPTQTPGTGPPTLSPVTAFPSEKPSLSPVTPDPTTMPSARPITSPPTLAPVTGNPTAPPSVSPVTQNPTTQPTLAPISSPPTKTPVSAPPTQSPVSAPPTQTPTTAPFQEPSFTPSQAPVVKPTWAPTSPTTPFPTGLIPLDNTETELLVVSSQEVVAIRGDATSGAPPHRKCSAQLLFLLLGAVSSLWMLWHV